MLDSSAAPELMAPAGDWDCARAAVENGADAVYFGLQSGLNARARAVNFGAEELPRLMTFLRTRGVRGYLTLNTLVFLDELPEAERTVRLAAAAGVDAILVQDLGLLRLVHRLCPELPLHASTQMTLSSAECIREVQSLGVRRVVLPRELSIGEIAAIRRETNIELEAFVHGALCISYSGQCLASLSLGGRSANRGQCAQPCRLPYEAVCDDRPAAMDERQYPLSPHDLAAYDRIAELTAAGVSALKIEGRLKSAEYVASVTRHYRAAIEPAATGPLSLRERARVRAGDEESPHPRPLSKRERGEQVQAGHPNYKLGPEELAEMEVAFSRGFCHGWLDGPDHRSLVSGRTSAKRGTMVGRVRGVRGERISVELAGAIRRGDGVVFQPDRGREDEQGGRVYEIFQRRRSLDEAAAGAVVELAFRYGAIDLAKIELGQNVWKTDDPQAARRLRKTYAAGRPRRRVALDVTVEAAVGSRMLVTAAAATGAACRVESPEPLPEATKHPLTAELLTEQFGRLGNTPYDLRRLDAKLSGRPMIPLSVLGKLRHEMVRLLDAAGAAPPPRELMERSALESLRQEATGVGVQGSGDIVLHVLCRSLEQITAALACGVTSLIADFRDPDESGEAVRAARAGGAAIALATPRIHKPGESDVFERLAGHRPDAVLARNLAGLAFFRRAGLPTVADFSLNAVNDLSAQWLHAQGAERVTAAYDLNGRQLLDLAAAIPPSCLEVVVHRHTPMFHSEYCVFCGLLSQGRNRADCGGPCRRHTVRLRDRRGVEHPLLADSQCRNTLFHAEAESLLELMPALRDCGIRHFRVELLLEHGKEEIGRLLAPYLKCWRSSRSV
jgi:U32 family peptidase